MIRLLAILIAAGLFATGAAWLADRQGEIDLVVGTYAIHAGTGVGLSLLFLVVVVLVIVLRLISTLLRAPGNVSGWVRARRTRRGYQALSHGLVAAVAGDAQAAHRFARRSERLLNNAPLSYLLTAQAAQLAGDEEKQQDAYRAMLTHSDTEFLGLRGLFLLAMRKGNEEEALEQALRAHALRPKAVWALDALFNLRASRREWKKAEEILKKEQRAKLITAAVAQRRRAVLLAAAALDADKAGDSETAMEAALEAVGLAPALIPAAALAARKLAYAGRSWKGQDIIEAAWTQAPHPELASAYGAIHPTDDTETRAQRLNTLAQLNPDHVESRILAAQQAIAQRHWFDARAALEPLTQPTPMMRACILMAEIAQAERGDVTAAQGWLARAAHSPRDAQWRCAHCAFVSESWAAICTNCGAFDKIAWVAAHMDNIEAITHGPGHMPVQGPAPVQGLPVQGPVPAHGLVLEADVMVIDTPTTMPNPSSPDIVGDTGFAPRAPDDPGIDPSQGDDAEDEYVSDPYEAESVEETPEGPVRQRRP